MHEIKYSVCDPASKVFLRLLDFGPTHERLRESSDIFVEHARHVARI